MSTPEQLVKDLERLVQESDSSQSESGSQRERNYRYYAMEPLGNEMPGRSRYIDPSVMDTVESNKAFMREVFFSGRRTVKFLPTEGESQEDADAKTAYVNRQLKLNNWFQIFRDALHDAYVAKRCVVHVEWDEDEDVSIFSAVEAAPDHLQWQLQQIADITDVDMEAVQQNPDGTITGRVRVITDSSRIKITLIPPENYFRDSYADYVENASFAIFSEDITRGDLINQGFDPEQVSTLDSEERARRSEEDSARRSHDGSFNSYRVYSRTDEQEMVTTYTGYAWLDMGRYMDGAPEDVRLYKVRYADSKVLRYEDGRHAIEEVSEMPFFEWTQYKVSHSSSGMCSADVMAPMQKTTSVMKRGIIDNMQMVNSTRWEVTSGAVKDLRALLDTTPGGVVKTRTPGAVRALETPQLSPMTMPALEMLETDKENRSGISRLSKGMNKDAVSSQNSDNMIERLTTAANKRISGEARDFAETFLSPIMRYIYTLGVRHDYRTYQLEVAGQQRDAAPQQWSEPAPLSDVSVTLTPQEGVKQAMSMMQMHQLLSTDPTLSMLYGLEQRHAMADELFDLLGVEDASQFMMTPGSPEFMQTQQAMQEQQAQQQQQTMQQMQFQAGLMQSADQREWAKQQTDARKTKVDIMNIASDNDRADEELDHQKVVDFAKLNIDKAKANGST